MKTIRKILRFGLACFVIFEAFLGAGAATNSIGAFVSISLDEAGKPLRVTNSLSTLAGEWQGFQESGLNWLMVINPDLTGALGNTDLRMPMEVYKIFYISAVDTNINIKCAPVYQGLDSLRIRAIYKRSWQTVTLDVTVTSGEGKVKQKIHFRRAKDIDEVQRRLRQGFAKVLEEK